MESESPSSSSRSPSSSPHNEPPHIISVLLYRTALYLFPPFILLALLANLPYIALPFAFLFTAISTVLAARTALRLRRELRGDRFVLLWHCVVFVGCGFCVMYGVVRHVLGSPSFVVTAIPLLIFLLETFDSAISVGATPHPHPHHPQGHQDQDNSPEERRRHLGFYGSLYSRWQHSVQSVIYWTVRVVMALASSGERERSEERWRWMHFVGDEEAA